MFVLNGMQLRLKGILTHYFAHVGLLDSHRLLRLFLVFEWLFKAAYDAYDQSKWFEDQPYYMRPEECPDR